MVLWSVDPCVSALLQVSGLDIDEPIALRVRCSMSLGTKSCSIGKGKVVLKS